MNASSVDIIAFIKAILCKQVQRR